MGGDRREPRKHIFAINSSPDFLLIVRELFEEEGYSVTISDFDATVITRIIMRHPNALIIDVAVEQPAAWDLLERLHTEAATTDIPVLVTSTSPALLAQAQEQAAWYGTHHYLEKPMSLDALVGIMREMIGSA